MADHRYFYNESLSCLECDKCGYEPRLPRMFVVGKGFTGVVDDSYCPMEATRIPRVVRKPIGFFEQLHRRIWGYFK